MWLLAMFGYIGCACIQNANILIWVEKMESFKFNGLWWLPDNPTERIAGILEFDSSNGARLELIGAFEDVKDFGQVFEWDIILGITTTGKKITLFKCLTTSTKMSIPGIITSSYSASFVFVGVHFSSEQDILFDYLDVNYQYGEEWAWLPGFDVKFESDSEISLKQYAVEYNFPQTIRVHLYDGTEISIQSRLTTSVNMVKNVDLKQKIIFNIKPPIPLGLDACVNGLCYKLQCFLSLAIGEPIYPIIIQARYHSALKEQKDKPYNNEVSIYFKMGREIKDSNNIHPRAMIFSLNDIRENLENYLNNWFKRAEDIRPLYDLFFAVMFNHGGFLESEFLTLTQAIESYHRRTMDGSYLSDSEFKQLYSHFVRCIPEDLEKDFKETLKDKFRYMNEFSLRRRLKELLNRYKDFIELIIAEPQKFINDIVNTRNYLTHYDKKLEEKALKDEKLFQLVEQIKVLIQILLFSELGFSSDFIKDILSSRQQYQYVREIKSRIVR